MSQDRGQKHHLGKLGDNPVKRVRGSEVDRVPLTEAQLLAWQQKIDAREQELDAREEALSKLKAEIAEQMAALKQERDSQAEQLLGATDYILKQTYLAQQAADMRKESGGTSFLHHMPTFALPPSAYYGAGAGAGSSSSSSADYTAPTSADQAFDSPEDGIVPPPGTHVASPSASQASVVTSEQRVGGDDNSLMSPTSTSSTRGF